MLYKKKSFYNLQSLLSCQSLSSEIDLKILLLMQYLDDKHSQDLGSVLAKCINLTTLLLNLNDNNFGPKDIYFIGSGLAKQTNLSSLELRICNNGIESLGAQILGYSLANCTKLQTLILHLWKNKIGSDGVIGLSTALTMCVQLSHLEIHIVDNQIGEEGTKQLSLALANCAHLKKLILDLSNNQIGQNDLLNLGQGLSKIENIQCLTLKLNKNKIQSQQVSDFFASLQYCINLQSLIIDLGQNLIGNANLYSLNTLLETCHKLTSFTLELNQNQIGKEGIIALASNFTCKAKLKHLDLNLSSNDIGSEDFSCLSSALANFLNLSNLQLKLMHAKINDEGLKGFAKNLSNCLSLQTLNLNLSYNLVQDLGALSLWAALSNCKNLVDLRISFISYQIGDASVKELGYALANCSKIQNLEVCFERNSVGDLGVSGLCSGLANCLNLKNLNIDLNQNEIGNNGSSNLCSGLANCINLQNLKIVLDQNQIIDEDVINIGFCLMSCVKLQNLSLEIDYNQISDQGALSLCTTLFKCPNLQTIILFMNEKEILIPNIQKMSDQFQNDQNDNKQDNKKTDYNRSSKREQQVTQNPIKRLISMLNCCNFSDKDKRDDYDVKNEIKKMNEMDQYSQCIYEYLKIQKKINQLILFNTISSLKKGTINENTQQQLEIEKNQQIITKMQNQFQQFLDSQNEKDSNQWNDIAFLYFKLTYFLTPEKYNKDDQKYQPNSQNLKQLIEYLTTQQELLNEQIQIKINEIEEQLTKEPQEFDYESTYLQQNFTPFFKIKYKHKYSDFFKKCQHDGILQFQFDEGILQKEESFFMDLSNCYNIHGNMQLIQQYRKRKSLLYFQSIDDFLEEESKTNLVRDYEIPFIKFFDKFDFYQVFTKHQFIDTLEEDETYLYFLIFSLLNLIKFDNIFIDKEQKLSKLITKANTFKNMKFKLGFVFLLKLMIDLKEKAYLYESEIDLNLQNGELQNRNTISLFKEWTKEKYPVSNSYFNQEQLQMYIDSIQSFLILAILPDLVLFYDLHENIPYQPTELDIGYIQQIIRGKRLYLKNPKKTEDNINYWYQLIQSMRIMIKKEVDEKIKKDIKKQNKYIFNKKQSYDEEQKQLENQFYFKICEINLNSCLKESKEKLESLIQSFVKSIDTIQYYNIYRHRQIYKALSSLFIEDLEILNSVKKLIKQSKIPHQNLQDSQQIKNLIISLKIEFEIETQICNKHYKEKGLDGIIQKLRKDFYQAQTNFQECVNLRIKDKINNNSSKNICLKKLKEAKKNFLNMINNFCFINNQKYLTIQINLQIYIKCIDLEIELIEQKQKQIKIVDEKYINKGQFEVFKIKTDDNRDLVMKQMCQGTQYDQIAYQIREISILSTIPQNKYIIKYIHYQSKKDYQSDKESFQLFLEYFESQTLLDYLKEQQKNKITDGYQLKQNKIEKLKICLQIVEAFVFLHKLNIIHGNIKPRNILISSQNGEKSVKIIDFSESGFMIEKTLGYTKGYEEKNYFNSKYKDYIGIGVVLIKTLYYCLFSYICDCQNEITCSKQTLHKQQLKMKFKNCLELQRNEYEDFLYKEIWSLFNDQPYLRCSLTQLIYIFKLQISLIQNQDEQFRMQSIYEYQLKYGQIYSEKQINNNFDKINNQLWQTKLIQSDDLINYFYIKFDESYPRIIQRLKLINFDIRKLGIDLQKFFDSKTTEMIYYIFILIQQENILILENDFLFIQKETDLFQLVQDLYKKIKISKEVKDKITNYYLRSFEY